MQKEMCILSMCESSVVSILLSQSSQTAAKNNSGKYFFSQIASQACCTDCVKNLMGECTIKDIYLFAISNQRIRVILLNTYYQYLSDLNIFV